MIIVNIIIFKGKTRVFLYISIDYKYGTVLPDLCYADTKKLGQDQKLLIICNTRRTNPNMPDVAGTVR